MPKLAKKVLFTRYKPGWYKADFSFEASITKKLFKLPGVGRVGKFYEVSDNALSVIKDIFKFENYQIETILKPISKFKPDYGKLKLEYLEKSVISNILNNEQAIFELRDSVTIISALVQVVPNMTVLVLGSNKKWNKLLADYDNVTRIGYNKIAELDKGYDIILLDQCSVLSKRNNKTSLALAGYLALCPPAHIGAFTSSPLGDEPEHLWSIWDKVRPKSAGPYWKFVKRYSNHTPTKFNKWLYSGLNPVYFGEYEARLAGVYKKVQFNNEKTDENFEQELSDIANNPNFEEGLF